MPAYTLRFWEQRLPGFLCPVRTEGGQRRYTEECLEKIRKLNYLVNEKGLSAVGARHRIEGGGKAEDEKQPLTLKVLGDKRLQQTIDEFADLIRRKILEAVGDEPDGGEA